MDRMKVGVLISGRGSNLLALLEDCAKPDAPAAIALVVSNVPGAGGLEHAAAYDVPSTTIDHRSFGDRAAFEREVDAVLRNAGVELICLAGFMRLLTADFVDGWRDRIINIHPSLLPAFKGLDTHTRALAAGVRWTGCTVHFVRPEVDSGPIIVQAAVPVHFDDDADRLAARVLAAEHRCYPLALRLIAEGRTRIDGDRVLVDGIAPASHTAFNPNLPG